MSDPITTPQSTPAAPRSPDRSHTRICLTDATHTGPMVSLFLVPEPRVRGASMLHLLEQVPVRDAPAPDPELTAALEAPTLPGAAIRLLPCVSRHADASQLRHIFHDHYIADGPMGLDVCDPEEMTRLAALPERAIGPRRIDDFADYSVRQAMLAVFRYFGVDQRIPLMYHGYADPGGRWLAVRTALA
ncbi:hypothetical protein J2W56_005942 [Nocardia kruczakiae]|uniref:Uncharacterized protein n=1 Tax=Nocardia kruczakiae TaxID=261477 RepID=A0ABU1XQ89_9NOCA|nr:hypothetical protein [Nocardia kruczakiae]MDR7172181.1 hypothetical protein [Nocardia kruczakiae]